MKWVAEKLESGLSVTFRPRGNSMKPIIESGQEVTLVPVDREIVVGDVVLCKVAGKYFLHKVLAVGDRGYQIGNNRGYINGWTRNIFGVYSPRPLPEEPESRA